MVLAVEVVAWDGANRNPSWVVTDAREAVELRRDVGRTDTRDDDDTDRCGRVNDGARTGDGGAGPAEGNGREAEEVEAGGESGEGAGRRRSAEGEGEGARAGWG